MSLIKEFWEFMKVRKKFWVPVLVMALGLWLFSLLLLGPAPFQPYSPYH